MNWFILTIFLILGSSLPHHPSVCVSEGEVRFYMDKALFQVNDSLFYSEIYYLLDLKTLKKKEVKGNLESSYTISVTLKDKEGKRKEIKDTWRSRAIWGERTQFVIDKFDLIVAPGSYVLEMAVRDNYGNGKGRAHLEFDVPSPNRSLHLSEIELAWEINSDTTSPFKKYGINVIPNPLANYNEDKDTLLFFYEIYNLNDSGKMVINYAVYDTTGNAVLLSKPTVKNYKGRKTVEVAGLHIGGLKEGLYKLVVEVVDLSSGCRARMERDFSFFSKERKFEITPEVDSILAFIDYFATPDEIKEFKKMKGEGRKLFLIRFWKKRDPNPDTPYNEFIPEFVRRVKYADENFSFAGRKGRYTDRGRIYIKYGPPDEIKRMSISFGEKDREKWIYYDGRMYIFLDFTGSGDYRLVYSNNPDEPGMPNWEHLIPRSDVEGVEEGTW